MKQMFMKDERVRVITEILAGIKILKLFSWEDSFIDKIGIFLTNYADFINVHANVSTIPLTYLFIF